LDSGSDLIAAIECAKAIAESIKIILTEVLDKILFWKIESTEKKMDAISKSLTLLGELEEAKNKQIINEETASNLKVRILNQVTGLFRAGATLPISERPIEVNQRKLLLEMRDLKLLGDGDQKKD
jgi:hypothetical protein